MFNNRRNRLILVLVMAAAFAAGLTKLFLLRFEAGDVYPVYSSLRSDPIGTQALYESLKSVTGTTVQRNFKPLDQLDFFPDQTVIICGFSPRFIRRMRTREWENTMDSLFNRGGRLVMAFRTSKADSEYSKKEKDNCAADKDKADESQDASKSSSGDELADIEKKWRGHDDIGFHILRGSGENKESWAITSKAEMPFKIPPMLLWRSTLHFELKADAWKTVYQLDGKPVIAYRAWGAGVIVLVADSYLFSNEAMLKHRFPDFLAWIFASHHRVVFDEFQKGLTKQPGIAGLAIKYRLQGVFAAIVLITVLIVWQQSTVFVPNAANGSDRDDDARTGVGGNTTEGLVRLMQQNIRSCDLIKTCFDIWKASPAANRSSREKIERIREIVNGSQSQKPAQLYRHICQQLKQGKIL
ncbi:MAG: hypothetical protein GY874_11270 [Desulfobacteraceae bacterium]|nr:hypothetical protein [Desulfobacteraceae bacterium]